MTDRDPDGFITRHEADRAHRLILLGIGFVILIGAVATFLSFTAIQNNADRIERNQVASCLRGNDTRAYIIIDAGRNARQPEQRQRSARVLFPIADCEADAVDGGVRQPPLPDAEADIYISRIAVQMGVPQWNVSGR